MNYSICPKCMGTFKTLSKKRKVHCDVKCLKVDKSEYKRVVNEYKP